MSIGKWLNKKAAILALSMSNVEKNTFGQTNEGMSASITQERRHTEGQLADSLINGIVSQEVRNLRWRTYKILKHMNGVKSEIVGYDEDGFPIIKIKKKNHKRELQKIKVDSIDSYELEMVVDNADITQSIEDGLDNTLVSIQDDPSKETDIDGNEYTKHGEISGVEYSATNKGNKPLIITRNIFPKFSLENFVNKMNVRKINDVDKLLEFYVSIYPVNEDRQSQLFLNEIKKAMENPLQCNMLELKEVEFITHNTGGVDDFLYFKYEVVSFDKIITFNGNYVIKFICKVVEDGFDTLEKYREAKLDKKYEEKASK